MTNVRTGLGLTLTSPVAEVTYGVAPSLSTAKFTEVKSESLELKKMVRQGIGIYSQKLYGQSVRRVVTEWDAGGAITMDLPARGLQQWLFPMFGSYGQTASALTQDGATGAYNSVHAPGPLESNSFVLQKGVPSVDNGTVEPFTYVGCKISEWELAVTAGEIAELTVTILARNELAGAGNSDPLNSVPSLQAFSAPAAGSVFHFAQASLYTGGTVSTTSGVTSVSSPTLAGNVKSVNIKQTVPLDGDRYFCGNQGFRAEPLQNGLRDTGGQFVIEWLSAETQYNAFAADTSTALELQFLDGPIGSGSDHSSLTILIANIHLEGDSPKVGGPSTVLQTVPFTALDDNANNVIQANYWTLDAS